ncbi:hypothetical protein [Micromonospora sp. NPDC092111]|uniref:hypothetical protein n=1 Tax=Micromonospora sp. NPDC092111 TaxID=3364289 RepID=UPI00380FF436
MTEEKRIPLASVGFTSDEARQAATDSYYLEELDRQAELAINSIYLAVMRGRDTKDPRDPKVWGALQNTLFAAICIARLLKPSIVKKPYHSSMTKQQSQQFADDRGKKLRDMLNVEDDCHILDVKAVRDAYEHYDEYFDRHLAGGAECFSDWYITDRNVLKTPPDQGTPSKAVGIRVFYPAGGILLFEDRMLHLFELEVELIELRVKIADALEEVNAKITGRALFGGHILEPVMTEQRAQQRFMEWQHRRAEALEELAKRKK